MSDSTFRDPDLPLDDRVTDLLGRLTLDEKVALLHQHQAPVPRLGVPAFRTGTEALHGMAWLGPATVFPQAVGLAASWNPELIRAVGSAVGDEVRGLHHKDPTRAGLNVWAPVVNPLRDPRWGRNEEGYSEDPWLTGVLGTAYAAGLRGDHPRYLRTAPTLKHFLGYNNETDRCLTSSNLPPRVLHEYELPAFRAPLAAGAAVAVMASYNLVNGRPAHLSPLIDTELRGYADQEIMVVGDAAAVSNIAGAQGFHADHPSGYAAALRAGIDNFTEDDADSRPTIDRITEALRRGLLDEADVDRAVRRILHVRFRLGEFDPPAANPYAAVTADVINCPAHQDLAREAARQSVVLLRNDGLLPLTAGGTRVAVLGPLADTVHQDWYSGTPPYTVSALDGLTARFGADAVVHHPGVDRIALRPYGAAGAPVRAGDGPAGAPLTTAPAGSPGSAEAGARTWFDVFEWGPGVVALRSVANGRHVGVDARGLLVNDRPGPGEWVVRETFRLVDRPAGGTALHHLASDRYVLVGPDGELRAEATGLAEATGFVIDVVVDGARAAAAAARAADVAVVVLGNHPMVCGRETEDRTGLALPPAQEALLHAVHTANPRTVLVLSSSYPYAVGWADDHLPAVLWSAHGGQEYGHALAAVLAGDADPGGRLTQTWYRDATELPDLLDYDIIATDATYLYYRGAPLYPFGHGLSYTTFAYSELRLGAGQVDADGEVEVSVRVTNTGPRAGEEVVQLYTRQRRSRVKQPLRQLRGFARVALDAGASTTVRFRLRAADLAYWDVTRGRYVVERARHTVAVGRSCADLALSAPLSVRGEPVAHRAPLAGPLRATDHDEYAGTVPLPDDNGGGAVTAWEPGGWLRFSGVDFGAGVGGVTARVAGRSGAGGTGTLTLRLDDPVAGPVAGTVPVPAGGGDRLAWREVAGRWLGGVTGVRDLYLLFDAPGATVSWLAFDAEARADADGDRSAAGSGGS
ncbi:glycoside hydrolase family 3 C-terminal domain-containing protein [Solwaraspora sp. WMMD1047]|uniref:glycoside hydrolase family 3 protein n=1 Tax=Solwaraspora sp. WMMD1047 TaxID=3016102 RepID=UPI0024168C52|nr:glycoside hydrolase family 3 protein [Solwaraspora sp. WMMD1047]MDG4831995.1 glycoside hydrolase family 3 C-terminal domain-containing protein [Solwaraspora sp. WMMD1047]